MKAVLLRKVRLKGAQLMLTIQEGGFHGEAAFFLVSGEERVKVNLTKRGEGKREEKKEGDKKKEREVGEEEKKEEKKEEEKKEEEKEEPGAVYSLELPNLREGDWVLSEKTILSAEARKDILLWGPRRKLPGDLLLFPLGGNGEELTLRVRKITEYDGPGTWFLERFSFGLTPLLKRLGLYKKSIVVFEKFCGQAQDNGFAFFSYCQRELPLEKRKRVFFILDQKSPSYQELKKSYGGQLLPFMGLRHMLLMQLSPLYVASESRYHGYLFRCVPNPVFREIRRGNHKIFFLQHGVTAQKRVDSVFGAHGYNPMDYMAATSYWEQEIIEKHFGYPKERVPVTGFTRWDSWRDERNPKKRYLLFCPTWRGYLDGKDEDFFRGSEYFRGYQSLLEDEGLGRLLREQNLFLYFCLHPRLHEQGGVFSSPFTEVSFVPYDGKSLPGLLMGAYGVITDFSSLAYDGAYLNRPVFFYRFDEERYNAETGGYIPREELPGPVADTKEDLLVLLEAAAKEGFPSPKLREGLFAYQDGKACERTVSFLRGQGYGI